MKILIINEYAPNNTNYGNCLQSYALSRYLTNLDNGFEVNVAYISRSRYNYIQTKYYSPRVFFSKVIKKINTILTKLKPYYDSEFRIEIFKTFMKQFVPICDKPMDYIGLKNKSYDTYIVGSDVVWAQQKYKFNRIKFLDFVKEQAVKKISYAASFGRDWIPDENIKDIKRCLTDFDSISVREASSINLLKEIGIDSVHVLDPTLLLEIEEWEKIEKEPDKSAVKHLNKSSQISIDAKYEFDSNHDVTKGISFNNYKYVFTYILGTDLEMRKSITDWAKLRGLIIVTIPYASGENNYVDSDFGDFQISRCSPQNWIWLIHHADFVITDSFHGTVFSTIFKKKFVVVKRIYSIDINNRMIDYLKTIEETDKVVSFTDLSYTDMMDWNYAKIDMLLNRKREFSGNYLKNVLLS